MDGFLSRVLPAEGDYVVVAIAPNGRVREVNGIPSIEAVATAAQKLSSQPLNVYVALGSYTGNRKAPRKKRALFLDLDGKDFGGKPAALRELTIFCKTIGMPLPAILVDSGNGLHCYWPFDQDIEIGPWKALAEALKGKCKELGFKADPTVTADAARILRVPGTLNHKSNPPQACRVLRDSGETYNPASLLRTIVGTGPTLSGPVPRAVLPAASINDDLADTGMHFEPPSVDDVASMLSVIAIPTDGSERRNVWLTVLAALHDWSGGSDEGFALADRWSSTQPAYRGAADVRKTWQSFGRGSARVTIASLIKLAKDAGWSPKVEEEPQPATVPDIILDDDESSTEGDESSFRATVGAAISKVRGQASAAAAAAGKVRAPRKDIEDILTRQFVYVKNQDTYYSLETRDLYTKESIRDIFTPDMPALKNGQLQDPCDLLRKSPKKIVVDSLGFHPGEGPIYSEGGKDFVNKYVQPPPELQPTPAEAKLFADFVDYIFPRPEDQVFKRYWLQFLAHAVQRPGVKIATALLFISEAYGVGKSTAALEIPRLLVGTDNARAIGNEILERPFTGYLGEAHLLHLSEVHVNGHWNSSAIANRLKAVITDSTLNVHKKGKDDYDIPNRILITATSNYTDAMYINSNQERRWGIYELRPARGYSAKQHRAYFDLVHRFLGSPRAAGVLRFIFKRISLEGFNPQSPPPITLAKERMVRLSASEEEQIVLNAMDNGDKPFHRDIFQMEEIRQLMLGETGKIVSSQKVARVVTRLIPDAKMIKQIRQGTGKLYVQCWRHHSKWEKATAEDILKELAK